jgi:precorrin-6B methylase 1
LVSIDYDAVVVANGDCLLTGSGERLIVCAKRRLLAAVPRIPAVTASQRDIQAAE